MEKKGIQINIGNLNRDIKTANRLMQSIRQMVRSLKGWLSDLKEKKVVFGGRLGEYKYYDMDAVIASALDMCEKELG